MSDMDRIELLKTYLTKIPRDSFLRHALALEYIKGGQEDQAITLFSKLLEDDPDYVGSYYHFGQALARTGRTEEALLIFEKGIGVARRLKEDHALRELQQAADGLTD